MPAPTVVNLRERFGRRFRIRMEESYYAQYGPNARVDDPHYQIIPGGRGHIYAWDDQRLAASTDTSGHVATLLKALPGVEVRQDGADGATVLFAVGLLDQVAGLLKLRRRRQISSSERARLSALGRRYGFKRRQHGSDGNSDARPCVPEGKGDPKHLPAQERLFGPQNFQK